MGLRPVLAPASLLCLPNLDQVHFCKNMKLFVIGVWKSSFQPLEKQAL